MSIKIKIVLLATLALSTVSCSEDFLETKPTDAIAEADAFATTANMALVINGLHRVQFAQSQLIPGGNTERAGNQYWTPLGDNIGGGVLHTAPANNLGWQTETQWNSHTQETSLTSAQLWYQRYHVIASANAVIKKGTDGSLSETPRLREIIAQAYAYRAFAYYDLITHYAKGYLIGNPTTDPGVPLLFSSDAPYTSAPRSTVEEIYEQIELDVNESILYFAGASAPSDKSQLSASMAQGLKARIALSKGDWQTAADAAVLARSGFPLMNESDYKSGFNTVALPEVIWGSVVVSTETTFFRSYFYLICNTFNGSQNRNNPKIIDRRLYNQIPDTDYRKDLFIEDAPNTNTSASNGQGGFGNDPNYTSSEAFTARRRELEATYGWTTRHNAHPYMHVKFLQKNPGSIDPDDIIYMRTSEMHLIEAEARAMLSDISGAQDALRPLGLARDSAYNVATFNTQALLMEHIKFQRGIELWGEGFLYTDKIRWDEGIDHEANGGSGASAVLYQSGFKQAKPSVNNDWIFKIPQAEIDANPNLTSGNQN